MSWSPPTPPTTQRNYNIMINVSTGRLVSLKSLFWEFIFVKVHKVKSWGIVEETVICVCLFICPKSLCLCENKTKALLSSSFCLGAPHTAVFGSSPKHCYLFSSSTKLTCHRCTLLSKAMGRAALLFCYSLSRGWRHESGWNSWRMQLAIVQS